MAQARENKEATKLMPENHKMANYAQLKITLIYGLICIRYRHFLVLLSGFTEE
jgi:hypothetical protein